MLPPLPPEIVGPLLTWIGAAVSPSAVVAVDAVLDQIEADAGPLKRAAIESQRHAIEAAVPAAVVLAVHDFLRRSGVAS